MKAKRIVFWAHLSAGVVAGLLVLVMSVTGVLLAYEHQLVAAADAGNRLQAVPAGASALSVDTLATIARRESPAAARGTLVLSRDPAEPARVTMGREGTLLLDPYAGAVLPDQAAGTRDFLRTVERWHRWLGGAPDSTRANLMDLANLVFLFIVCSGIYIWLPDRWKWPALRARLLFHARPPTSRARDYNWHHVFSAWALLPLLLIVASGVVMSFPWANRLVFAAYGEQPPQRGGPPGEGGAGPGNGGMATPRRDAAGGGGVGDAPAPVASLESLLAAAKSAAGEWRTLRLPLAPGGGVVTVTAELAGDPAPRQTLRLDRAAATVLEVSPSPPANAATGTPGQQARRWFRFVHTGEQYGIAGQTVAMLATLAACFLVYTGLALAWRRLIVPLWRPRA